MLAGGDRIAPFFEFKSNRLVQWPNTAPYFPSYLDGYGKIPYAYFSSYKTSNGYNRYLAIANPYMPAPTPGADRPVSIGIIGTGNQGQADLSQMVKVAGVWFGLGYTTM